MNCEKIEESRKKRWKILRLIYIVLTFILY